MTQAIKVALRKAGITVCDPAEWDLSDTNFLSVCRANELALLNAKRVVFVCTDPSIGLGVELQIARTMDKAADFLFDKKAPVQPAWAAFIGARLGKMFYDHQNLVANVILSLRDE